MMTQEVKKKNGHFLACPPEYSVIEEALKR